MGKTATALLEEALTLPEAERASLAGALLGSLEPATDADVEQAWKLEVAARVAAADAGKSQTVAWPDLRERWYTRLRERASG